MTETKPRPTITASVAAFYLIGFYLAAWYLKETPNILAERWLIQQGFNDRQQKRIRTQSAKLARQVQAEHIPWFCAADTGESPLFWIWHHARELLDQLEKESEV